MKIAIVLTLLSACAAVAQTSSPPKPPEPASPDPTRAEFRASPRPPANPVSMEQKYSGVLVDVKRAGNLFKLFDPKAPVDPLANVSRDPITGHAEGIKLFAVRF